MVSASTTHFGVPRPVTPHARPSLGQCSRGVSIEVRGVAPCGGRSEYPKTCADRHHQPPHAAISIPRTFSLSSHDALLMLSGRGHGGSSSLEVERGTLRSGETAADFLSTNVLHERVDILRQAPIAASQGPPRKAQIFDVRQRIDSQISWDMEKPYLGNPAPLLDQLLMHN